MTGILVAGTSSDAGKSLVVTALCRVARRRGVDVVPFKSPEHVKQLDGVRRRFRNRPSPVPPGHCSRGHTNICHESGVA